MPKENPKSGTLNELLDMLVFTVGIKALTDMRVYGIPKDAEKHLETGMKLGKMINSKRSLALTLSDNWKTLENDGAKLTGLKRLYAKASRDGSWGLLMKFYPEFATGLLGSNANSPHGVGQVFTLPAQWRILKNISHLVNDSESKSDLVVALGKFSLLMAGKGKATKRLILWAKDISKFGVIPDSISDDVDRAESEINAGDRLGKAKRKFEGTDNGDPDRRLNAEMELAEAEGNAQTVINNSTNPDSAKSRIITQAIESQKDLGFGVNDTTGYAYQTAVGAKYGLNDEQEKMLTSSGKVIMAAGAGAGKTHTLTALIEHMCSPKKDGGKGLRASQILVSSFTVAASQEIKDRVNNKSNVRIAEKAKGFGTVHSLSARNINQESRQNAVSREERPQGAKYVGKDQGYYLDQIMLLALRQVSMSGGGAVPDPTNLFTGAKVDFDPSDVEKGLQEMLRTQESLETKGVKMTADVLKGLKLAFEHFAPKQNHYTGEYDGKTWSGADRSFQRYTNQMHAILAGLLNPSFISAKWEKYMFKGQQKNKKVFQFSYSPKYKVGDKINGGDVDATHLVFSKLPSFGAVGKYKGMRLAKSIYTATQIKTGAKSKKEREPIMGKVVQKKRRKHLSNVLVSQVD